MIRTGDGTGHFLHIKDGVTQGDPLTMILYGLWILLLIQYLWKAHPIVTQPWYADDPASGRTFSGICQHLDNLMVRGLLRGYFPDPTRRILVVSAWNVPHAEIFFCGYCLKVVVGGQYMERFVGT